MHLSEILAYPGYPSANKPRFQNMSRNARRRVLSRLSRIVGQMHPADPSDAESNMVTLCNAAECFVRSIFLF